MCVCVCVLFLRSIIDISLSSNPFIKTVRVEFQFNEDSLSKHIYRVLKYILKVEGKLDEIQFDLRFVSTHNDRKLLSCFILTEKMFYLA